ncbi:MAG: hypothetical protein UIG52_05660 [Bacteroidales bacterium]|nr:hypothetical protein [Bacteroidales bacterium]MEE0992190.1 hypothetical protein [Bacteroidales bacterium]
MRNFLNKSVIFLTTTFIVSVVVFGIYTLFQFIGIWLGFGGEYSFQDAVSNGLSIGIGMMLFEIILDYHRKRKTKRRHGQD